MHLNVKSLVLKVASLHFFNFSLENISFLLCLLFFRGAAVQIAGYGPTVEGGPCKLNLVFIITMFITVKSFYLFLYVW